MSALNLGDFVTRVYANGTVVFSRVQYVHHTDAVMYHGRMVSKGITLLFDEEGIEWVRGRATHEQVLALRAAQALVDPEREM